MSISKFQRNNALFSVLILAFVISTTKGQTLLKGPTASTHAADPFRLKSGLTYRPSFGVSTPSDIYGNLYAADPDCVPQTTALSANQNYILLSLPRISGITTSAGLANKSTCELMQMVQYFDGLGHPMQTVQVKGSPLGKDVVQATSYDSYGREAYRYLPYTSPTADGSYKVLATSSEIGNFYNPGGGGTSGTQQGNGIVVNPQPYAVSNFEASPLGRVAEQGAPGAAWQPVANSTAGHTVKISYGTNAANEVLIWNVNSAGNGASFSTTYAPGQLYKTVTTDENGNNTREYKDKKGDVICKVSDITGDPNYTYYVYNDINNLQYVIPPMAAYPANFVETDAVFNNLIYGYHYDEQNRLIQKKIPGMGWEYMVYNKLDQLVLSQDAKQRLVNQWTSTKYDALGRVIMTGLWNAGAVVAQSALQVSIYAGAQWDSRDKTNNTTTYPVGYVMNSYPALSVVLTVNYYDDYTNIPGIPAAFIVPGNNMTQGALTATKVAVLNTITNSSPDMMWTAHYYDDLGRSTKLFEQHYLGGVLSAGNYDVVTSTYNFSNQVTTTTRQHFTSASTSIAKVTISNRYIYDHMGRKLKTWEQIQNGALAADTRTLLSQTEYNETGQPWKKHLHSTDSVTFKQDITYTYNERGWLKGSSAQLFEEQLQYNTSVVQNGLTPVPRYNSDIASQSWGTLAAPDTKTYIYKYDQVNRLTDGTASNLFSEQAITYDKTGNITKLKRYTGSATATDDLTYDYLSGTTNQLQSITDGTASDVGQKHGTFTYAYDVNGNMVTDNSKGITGATGIVYNLLNLPQSISSQSTIYTYTVTGQKLRRVIGTTAVDYVSGIQYDAATISFIQTEEGRALSNGATAYNYEYSLSDHLGNSRVNFDTGSGVARQVQADDYYPFGMEINNSFLNPKNEYLYNKKEFQESLGLYDYGARFYNPVLGRWTTIDPLAESGRKWSAYCYVMNNPIRNIDPDGMLTRPIAGGWEFSNADGSTDASDAFALIKSVPRTTAQGSLGIITFGKEYMFGKAIQNIFSNAIYQNVPAGAHQGGYRDFYTALKKISNLSPNGIGFLAIFSHGGVERGFGNPRFNEGMIFANAHNGYNPSADNVFTSDLAKLGASVSSGAIKFAAVSLIYLGGCNTATPFKDGKSFAMELSKATGSVVIGAYNGHMNAVDPNSRTNTTYYPDPDGSIKVSYWSKMFNQGFQTQAPSQKFNVVDLINHYFDVTK